MPVETPPPPPNQQSFQDNQAGLTRALIEWVWAFYNSIITQGFFNPASADLEVTTSGPITTTGGTSPEIGITEVTIIDAGSMSAADKAKLDGIEALADVTVNANVLAALANEINQTVTNGSYRFSGGTAGDGGQLILYGSTHATKANDIELVTGASLRGGWDDSAGAWDWQSESHIGVNSLTAITLVSAIISPAGAAKLVLNSSEIEVKNPTAARITLYNTAAADDQGTWRVLGDETSMAIQSISDAGVRTGGFITLRRHNSFEDIPDSNAGRAIGTLLRESGIVNNKVLALASARVTVVQDYSNGHGVASPAPFGVSFGSRWNLPGDLPEEHMLDPDFNASGDWWTGLSGGWALGSNKATKTAGNTNHLGTILVDPIDPGEKYQLTWTLSGRTAGSVTPSICGVDGTARSSNADHTEIITIPKSYAANGTFNRNFHTLVQGGSQTGVTLIVDKLEEIPIAGDTFTIAGDATVYTVSSATAVSVTTSTLTITPTLAATPADNAALTFTGYGDWVDSGSSWLFNTEEAYTASAGSDTLTQDISVLGTFVLAASTYYRLWFSVKQNPALDPISGTITPKVGGTAGAVVGTDQPGWFYQDILTPTVASGNLTQEIAFTASSFVGSIDTVKVVPIELRFTPTSDFDGAVAGNATALGYVLAEVQPSSSDHSGWVIVSAIGGGLVIANRANNAQPIRFNGFEGQELARFGGKTSADATQKFFGIGNFRKGILSHGGVTPFTAGTWIYGVNSEAIAWVDDASTSGELLISKITGTFNAAEVIKDIAGNTATTNAAVVLHQDAFINELVVVNDDANAASGPTMTMARLSPSPADNDILGVNEYLGRNDANQNVIYAQIAIHAVDVTNGTEDGKWIVSTMKAGTLTVALTIDQNGDATIARNIVVGGTVDGRDVAADGTKLDGIETGATKEVAATLTVAGIVELATVTETNTGTDATRAVTPDGLDGWAGSAQIVTTGALNSGSITSGFGAINIGSSALTCGAFTSTGIDDNASGTMMTLENGGTVAIGRTSSAVAGTEKFTVEGVIGHKFTGSGIGEYYWGSHVTASTSIQFRQNAASNVVGSISHTTTATAYNTSSDERLKNNVRDMPDAKAARMVMQLRPVLYEWKATGEPDLGFLAHEVQAVLPNAVLGERGAVDENGDPVMQQYDPSKLVPLLTSGLQMSYRKIKKQQTQINDLIARLDAAGIP